MNRSDWLVPTIVTLVLLSLFHFNNLSGFWSSLTNRRIAHIILASTIVTLILVGSNNSGEQKRQIKNSDVYLILFFVFVTIQVVIHPHLSVNNEKHISLALLFLLYFTLRALVDQWNIAHLNKGLLSVVLVTSIYGLLQYLNELPAESNISFIVVGTFNNSGPYAGYLASLLPWVLYIVVDTSGSKNLWFWLGLFTLLIGLFVIMLTQSRAAWVATFIILVYYFYPTIKQHARFLKHSVWLFVFLALLFVSTTALIYLKKDSALGRLFIWQVALQAWQENPLWGRGTVVFLSFIAMPKQLTLLPILTRGLKRLPVR